MRSLLSLPARPARRGLLGTVAAATLAFTAGCSFLTGIPDVDRVDISLAPNDTIPAGVTATALATAFGKNDKILNGNSRIRIGFTSSNPAVATVDPTTGQIIGISEGTTVITARARDKSDTVTMTIRPTVPNQIQVIPPVVAVGQTVPLDVRPLDQLAQLLPGRKINVTASSANVLRVNNSGTTAVTITGLAVGSTVLTIEVDGQRTTQNVTVTATPPSSARLFLSKGTNTLLIGESNQLTLELKDAAGNVIPNNQQTIGFSSDDQTVATVSSTGIVTGQRAGTVQVRATIQGVTFQGLAIVTVQDLPAKQVLFGNRSPFVRIQSDGTGLASPRPAAAFDSVQRQLVGRVISYRSTDTNVLTINSLGTVTPRRLGGQASIIASADNGAVADTLSLRVTEVPIAAVTITPRQSQVFPGQTVQLTTRILDSLANTVTSADVSWFTSNVQLATVTATGLVTALNAGTVGITVQVPQVPGLPAVVSDQVTIIILPTPVASIDVAPTSVQVRVGQTTTVSVITRDANGNQLFNRNVNGRPDDPSIVFANGSGTITGLKAGTTNVTYQALDQASNPQGTPKTITVTVTP